MRRAVLTAVMLCGVLLQIAPAAPPPPLSQRDWMVHLVEGLGLSFGLPENPTDADYLRILSGQRHLRVEAEESHRPTDMVSINSFRSFGPFSGTGWLNGIAQPTRAHLRFLLPRSGRYRIGTAVRSSGHLLEFGSTSLRVDAPGGDFHTVALGEIELLAGWQEVTVHLPPNASIDYLELTAPPLPPLAPRDGWNPSAPLTLDDLAVTSAQLLELEPLLPTTQERVTIEAEDFAPADSPLQTDVGHLGPPSGGRWLRAGIAPQQVEIAFTPPQAGVYDLILRGAAAAPLKGTFETHHPLQIDLLGYLSDTSILTRGLPPTRHTLTVELSGRAGVDALFLLPRRSARSDYLRLLGLPEREPPQAEDLNRLLALLALLQPPR